MTKWNKGQQEVLDSLSLSKNILVSAAAGSGKTAVLVERIIRTVVEGYADIDEILVVTFMTEAAAQMRTKIIRALEVAASSDPDGRIARQLAMAEKADIMTIDSFCNKIVRENFSLVDMDPSFDIYDGSEIALLKDDILDSVLDGYYSDEDTVALLTEFIFQKNIDDTKLKEYILKIHNVAQSYASPDAWLEDCRENVSCPEDVTESKWVRDYINYYDSVILDVLHFYADLVADVRGGMYPGIDNEKIYNRFIDLANSDQGILWSFRNAATMSEKSEAAAAAFKRIISGNDAALIMSSDQYQSFKGMRDYVKGLLKGFVSEGDVISEAKAQQSLNNILIDIVRSFDTALMKEKKRQKKYEFSDVAHAAYRILYDVDKGCPTAIGRAKSHEYKYIYIDEYQDSSDLQENLLNAVARSNDKDEINNIFMVGDVKQSIYRFRMARPEFFTAKNKSYINGDGGIRISLNMNYRSRREVLDATNYIFDQVMTEQFGGISYTDDVRLNPPAGEDYQKHYPDTTRNAGGRALLCRIGGLSDDDSGLSMDELEAIQMGHIIQDIVNGDESRGVEPLYIINESFDNHRAESENNPRYRRATYGDIVILQRRIRKQSAKLRIFEQMGIPVHISDAEGYFEALEISTLLSILRVIDNPEQDIPYASVLLSHIGGLTDSELARIAGLSADRYMNMYDKSVRFIEGYVGCEDEELRVIAEKLSRINQRIDRWSEIRPFLSISDLIGIILSDTDYESFVAAMPEGARRIQNIHKLGYYARQFEKNRNVGLLDFLKFIDKCNIQGKDMDDGGGSVSGDVVNITSIHKSKGLEYPIVLVGQMGKDFNFSDTSGYISVNQDYHLCVKRMKILKDDIKLRKVSVKENMVKTLNQREVQYEEARLLYVAMTRAKEKLIMIGTTNDAAPVIIDKCKSYMDYANYAIQMSDESPAFDIEDIAAVDVVGDFSRKYIQRSTDYSSSLKALMERVDSRILLEKSRPGDNPYDYMYPYIMSTKQKAKMSVSEIKAAEMKSSAVIEDRSDIIVDEYEVEVAERRKEEAARRGTLIHLIFERLDYNRINNESDLEIEISRIMSTYMESEDRALIKPEYLLKFYSDDDTSLFQRMKTAYRNGRLHREQRFIAGIDVADIPMDEVADIVEAYMDGDYIVIQGIIDAYFNEGTEDDIILVDYKTDSVSSGPELLDRYASQMYLYGITIERLTGKRVVDCILYSTRLGEIHYTDWSKYLENRGKRNGR